MSTDKGLKIGVARRDITPENPHLLTQTGMGRLEQTIGVLDELFAEALAIETGGEAALIVTADLLSIDRNTVFRVQDEVGRRLGIDGHRVLLSSTHDHSSSPMTWKDAPREEAQAALLAAREKIIAGMVGACVDAWENRRPAEIAFTEAELKAPMGENRRIRLATGACVQSWGSGAVPPPGEKFAGPAGPDSTNIRILAIREVGKAKPFALLTSYPSHIHLANLPYFSGETAGAVKRELQRRLGNKLIALYANGHGGNIDIHCIHPQALGPLPELVAWFQQSQKILAKRFADAVVPAVNKLRRYTRPRHLTHRYWTTGDEVARQNPKFPHAIVNSLALGDIALISVPGEVFIEYHFRLVKKSPIRKFMLLSFNGTDGGYIAHPLGFEMGGYETMRGPVLPGDGEPAVRPGIYAWRATAQAGEELESIVLEEMRGLIRG
jgi:hypothetical protein